MPITLIFGCFGHYFTVSSASLAISLSLSLSLTFSMVKIEPIR